VLKAHIGVNEVSGLMTSVTFDPQLPSNYFPPEAKRPEGQVGDSSETLTAAAADD
jgi:hypothetical protein